MSLYSYPASNRPGPFASLVDILDAGSFLEEGIHSGNRIMAQRAIKNAAEQVAYAKDYFEAGGYTDLHDEAEKAVVSLNALAGEALTTGDFAEFREKTLYDFQGVLGGLFQSTFRLFGNLV